ncbi:cell wall metabolism sensor histidine kinase WalK [Paenibacillus sp. YN15]|uniref:sensor histidine kinase n=1 Tax=Paenibacillus sp. YN15 TaxID=1742774 RepID=UPI000DCD1129|nr:HAMP domain-containing sensor histidine kinase [Paenibacillus sp. YN15]RAV05683.1 two-component sensor histidine kinase [Paenibacillus sp. YN15]
MNLTKRFYVLNLLTMLGAVGLTILAAVMYVAVYTKILGRETYLDGMAKAYEVRQGLHELKNDMQTYTFDQLSSPAVQQQLRTRVLASGGEAVLVKNNEVLYATMLVNSMDAARLLLLTDSSPDQTFQLEEKTYFYERISYSLAPGSGGALLLLAPVRLNMGFYKTLGLFAAAVFVLSLLLLNAWVSWRFSRAVIRPVFRLKDAAAKISEGDLDGGIAEEGEGEVRELGRTLEIMRIRLKESVDLQQKYDENRKFLVSSISHDLKTPVTSIKGYIEGILDGVARTPEKMQEYLETARSKAELVNTLMDDLLLYSSLDLNQLPYHFEETDLVRYFEDCIADNQYEFQRAGVRLSLAVELEQPAKVRMDRERFKRVIQNIMDNALKYMDKPDGQVAVVLRETRTSAIIEIQDNGRGIPEEDLPYVFDRFYRVDASRKNASGSGLGLAIAKQIVEGHEGSLWARSQPGQGTRMMISLKKS